MKRTNAGELNATTGRTLPPPLTDGHEMPHMLHVEDLIAQGHIPERVRLAVETAVSILNTGATTIGREAFSMAVDFIVRAEEWDRHERFQKR